jgi:hypothetical protein
MLELDRRLLFPGVGFMRSARLPLLALGLLVVASTSCITPSIPIPPPDPARMEFMFMGDAANRTTSFVYPPNVNYVGSVVLIYDRSKGHGIIEDANVDGSVGPTAQMRADIGDEVVVSFQRDDQTVSTCIRLREGSQNPTDYCGP